MVKVEKVLAYRIGSTVFTDRSSAERAARQDVLREVLEENIGFSGLLTADEIAHTLSEHWDDIGRRMTEAFRGIS